MTHSLKAAQGLKKGSFSKSEEDAFKWRQFEQTVNQAREAFTSLSDGELRDAIDKAILKVRNTKKASGRGSRCRK